MNKTMLKGKTMVEKSGRNMFFSEYWNKGKMPQGTAT